MLTLMTNVARLRESSCESANEYSVGGEGVFVGASGAKGAMLATSDVAEKAGRKTRQRTGQEGMKAYRFRLADAISLEFGRLTTVSTSSLRWSECRVSSVEFRVSDSENSVRTDGGVGGAFEADASKIRRRQLERASAAGARQIGVCVSSP